MDNNGAIPNAGQGRRLWSRKDSDMLFSYFAAYMQGVAKLPSSKDIQEYMYKYPDYVINRTVHTIRAKLHNAGRDINYARI